MKKFRSLLILCISIILVFSVYYGTTLNRVDSAAEIDIKYVSGNKKEIKDMLIFGQHMMIHNSNFIVNSKGENLLNNKSYFEKLNSVYYYDNNIYNLYKNHRSFMRGKTDRNIFYEDNNEVISVMLNPKFYANRKADFEVEVLNKESNSITRKEFSLDKAVLNNAWYHLAVADIQKENDKILIMLEAFKDEKIRAQQMINKTEYTLVTYDLKADKLVNEEVILSSTSSEEKYSQMVRVEEVNFNTPSQYFVRIDQKYKRVPQKDGGILEEETSKDFVIYDYKNKKFLESPANVSKFYNANTVLYSGNEIYIQEASGNEQSITVYDILSGKQINKVNLKLPVTETIHSFTIHNYKLYTAISGHTEKGYSDYKLSVINIKTGANLYQGLIKNENNYLMIGKLYFNN